MDSSESTYGRKARVIAVVVLLLAVTTTVGQAVTYGPAGALEGLIFVYVASVLAYGVFRNELETPYVQIAFGLGIGAYGVLLYLSTGSLLWLALAAIAVLLVARNVAFIEE